MGTRLYQQQRRSAVPTALTLDMLAELPIFCGRCETQVMGGLVAHRILHDRYPAVVRPEMADYRLSDPVPQKAPEASQIEWSQRYSDAIFDID